MTSKKALCSLFILALSFASTTIAQNNPGACPQDNGEYRTTSAGTFLITCNKKTNRGYIGSEQKPSLAECIDACAANAKCKSVDYEVATTTCRYINGAFVPMSAGDSPLVHNAYRKDRPVAPPPVQSPVAPGPVPPPVPPVPIQSPIQVPIQPPDPPPVPPGPSPLPDSGSTTNPTCPGDDGKTYVTADGTWYKLQCGYHSDSTMKLLKKGTADSYALCMEKCSTTPNCTSIKYQARAGSGQGQFKDCMLYSSNAPSTDKCGAGTEDFAYTIDPPEQEFPDYPNKLCSTDCPYADGMTYNSKFGEAFKMDCGKRHGTKYFGIAQAASFKECMDSCAEYVPCRSVDYTPKNGKCYMGSHSGKPMITANSFMSAHAIGCAGACGECCGGIAGAAKGKDATPAPPKEEGPCRPDLSCNNRGLIYGSHPNKGGTRGASIPADLNFVDGDTPAYKGSSSKIGLPSTADIYGHPNTYDNIAVEHHGYLFAQEAGEYTFEAGLADDYVLMWVGPKAINGWTKDNPDLHTVWGGAASASYKITLAACSYNPIRVLWGNTGGPGAFEPPRILAPNGTVLIDKNTVDTPFLLQFPCEPFDGPKFGRQL